MCQLLGLNSSVPAGLGSFFDVFAERGGRTDEHKDGWGIAFHSGKRCRLYTDHRAAIDSPLAARIRHRPLRARNILAHIRKATQGRIALENSHPFARRLWGLTWCFAHNGDLKGFAPAAGRFAPRGDTDSEAAFCHLLSRLAERFPAGAPDTAVLRAALADVAAEIATHGTFNFILSNGDTLFAHCSTHLHYRIDAGRAMIATQPVDTRQGWVAFAPGELKAFGSGTLYP
ncbi:glutamine amidotransferase [Pseudoduganella flava]|uniref:Glutamine amidotransferase n=1 Tax=Pseudoduganella flava TaxID=871742 RepID=A0A562Q0M3_9BURK|nr:class II glutamine amidotransferase [Pseudoduganella flava]QGZ38460.1 class II glutamine amidotransferase [Pseudoduganella flava]TWI49990.1 glutamine amidotransferase [Pseudoduganella flava]